MAFIPMPYTVTVTRPGGADTGTYDAHGNPILTKPTTFEVSAAGWSSPGDEAAADARQALGVDLAIELMADTGRIALGDVVTIDGDDYRVVRLKSFENGPFGFRPGLDVLHLTARKG